MIWEQVAQKKKSTAHPLSHLSHFLMVWGFMEGLYVFLLLLHPSDNTWNKSFTVIHVYQGQSRLHGGSFLKGSWEQKMRKLMGPWFWNLQSWPVPSDPSILGLTLQETWISTDGSQLTRDLSRTSVSRVSLLPVHGRVARKRNHCHVR